MRGPSLVLTLLHAGLTAAAPTGAERLRLGEQIYREGRLPSGQPLRATRVSGEVSGADAACVLCHRRSGMGSYEGNRLVPPVAGPYLFQPRATTSAEMTDARHTRGADLAHALGRERPRPPYTEASLLAAIRDGQFAGGGELDPLMPRYPLRSEEASLLVAYLRQLSSHQSPGVSTDTLQLATVIAPGVDPVRRRALLDVLQNAVAVHNTAAKLERLRDRDSPGSSHARYRAWNLQVWELKGEPASWDGQLAAAYRRQPVFALLSGLSEGEWGPVERFGERMGVPCWFPTVDLPPVEGNEFYSTYYTGGVGLEAAVLAQHLSRAPGLTRILQVRGKGTAEERAARGLGERLAGTPVPIEERPVGDAAAIRDALSGLKPSDAVVLWLRSGEVAWLAQVPPPPGPVYLSSLLAGAEQVPLPPGWRRNARLVYPFELPERRRSNVTRFHSWLRTRNLALVDERVQAEAYLAVQLFSARVEDMLEALYRDYLVERAESFVAERVSPVIFRGLTLGPGQRVASKGAYVVRFTATDGTALTAESEWIVP